MVNLHAIAGPIVSAINPTQVAALRISTGTTVQDDGDGTQVPKYATPGAFTGSIAGTVLTVASVAGDTVLQVGQLLASVDVLPGTTITELGTGTGGAGTYEVSRSQTVASEAFTTSHVVEAQVQPLTAGDLQQLEGINLGGVRWKAYLYGEVDAIVRPESKGGDLVVIASGRHQGTWLVVTVLEQFQDWVSAAIVIQNDG